jgi:signal transduction histidine kinase
MQRSSTGPRRDGVSPGPPPAGRRLAELLDEMQERLATAAQNQAEVRDLLDALLTVSSGSGPDGAVEPAVDTRAGALAVLPRNGAARGAAIQPTRPPPRRLDVYEDRDRIAQDLHDHVIQRLFAAGLSLQSVVPRIPDPEARRRIRGVVAQLDETVGDIRTAIFDLHTSDEGGHQDSLRRRILDTVTDTAGGDIHPTVRMSGAVDTLVTGELAADVDAVAREAVSNAARHAGATHVTVTLDVTDEVVLEVVDDGRGIDVRAARSGLRNLADRAQRRRGECHVAALPDGGTRLRWWAPLR